MIFYDLHNMQYHCLNQRIMLVGWLLNVTPLDGKPLTHLMMRQLKTVLHTEWMEGVKMQFLQSETTSHRIICTVKLHWVDPQLL